VIEIDHAADRAAAAEWARAALADDRAVILDTETTDLRGYIVDIAIIRATDGEVLMNTLVDPCTPIHPEAFAVHGIQDADVVEAPTFAGLWPELRVQLEGRRVLVYNASYDAGRIGAELDRTTFVGPQSLREQLGTWECIMLQHAQWVGEWNDYHGNYRWHKLTGGDHRALGDCRAARARLIEMAGAAPA
jgi:hypothetical protein